MKKWVFLSALLSGLLYFSFAEESENECPGATPENGILTEKGDADTQHRLEFLSSELKSRTCVLPRRTVQPENQTDDRTSRSWEKNVRQIRLKGENRLQKVIEMVLDRRTLFYYTLLCRRGYYVYALRKLLI